MRNSIAAGRRLAARLVITQLGVSLLLALLFLAQGVRPALAAFAGGMLVAVGTAVLAARLFAQTAPQARGALLGLVAGTVLKWLIVLGGLYALLGVFRLPALPVVTGFAAVLLSHLAAARISD